ncbi:hypothetical protein HYS31_02605 [Candidatus Woesearchaeota archaeon]|nr:hypothetical protein [Candidatus Woesearchaeota archaeon]
MKIRLIQILSVLHIALVMSMLKEFSIAPLILIIAALSIDFFTGLRTGMKNLAYILACLSVFLPLLWLFLLFLPFAVFGLLLGKKGFAQNYIIGFVMSFTPTTAIYLLSTYLSVRLSLPLILAIFYLAPLIAVLILKGKFLSAFELESKEAAFFLIIISLTIITGSVIIDDKSLFMANGVREFSRMQPAIDGFSNGAIPIYDPSTGQGEATFLWIPPTYSIHFALGNYLLDYFPRILLFNLNILFILLLSAVSLGLLLDSIISREKSALDWVILALVTALIGLNFFFLQFLESTKQFYSYPMSYLFLAIIISNPRKFNEFLILMFISAIIMTIHPAYGFGVIIIGFSLLLITKSYYVRDRSELKEFLSWAPANKLKIAAALLAIACLPLFYFQSSIIFSDFLYKNPGQNPISASTIKSNVLSFFDSFIRNDIKILSLKYPDPSRIDDHKTGAFISIFGAAALIILLAAYKVKSIKKFRIFAFGYFLSLLILSLLTASLTVVLGGLFRTNQPYFLVLMGASIISFVFLFENKYFRIALAAVILAAFLHSLPHARENLANIHREQFASGEIYKNELDFIKKLPNDGRIMTYGLFANAIDFGAPRLTGKYFSRDEREELASFDRNAYAKIHGQNSFGDQNYVLSKPGVEIANYLILGGYKYVFTNACHPVGNYVALNIYPNFSHPIYQNECFVILLVNKANYAEKIDLSSSADDETYRKNSGYKYVTIGNYYNFDLAGINYSNDPKEPESLRFERETPTKVRIFGDFDANGWVVFKERHFPRWKAYMDGKEVPVFSTNHELILIKTIKGSSILLEYKILGREKIFGIVSLAGFVGFIILLLVLLKREIPKQVI